MTMMSKAIECRVRLFSLLALHFFLPYLSLRYRSTFVLYLWTKFYTRNYQKILRDGSNFWKVIWFDERSRYICTYLLKQKLSLYYFITFYILDTYYRTCGYEQYPICHVHLSLDGVPHSLSTLPVPCLNLLVKGRRINCSVVLSCGGKNRGITTITVDWTKASIKFFHWAMVISV